MISKSWARTNGTLSLLTPNFTWRNTYTQMLGTCTCRAGQFQMYMHIQYMCFQHRTAAVNTCTCTCSSTVVIPPWSCRESVQSRYGTAGLPQWSWYCQSGGLLSPGHTWPHSSLHTRGRMPQLPSGICREERDNHMFMYTSLLFSLKLHWGILPPAFIKLSQLSCLCDSVDKASS